ncbi:hypothetical protein IFM12275_15490 [Nocardia sputorum]|uniref:hypothetical protein n=1 Tax=Nocardia TaxID=1817 RepID=UPI002491552E|nr:hypothetical protein [Nocardia sputorum]BDT91573.1 hypothetical protein IFM12275_15490 [Nocardia sputorum]
MKTVSHDASKYEPTHWKPTEKSPIERVDANLTDYRMSYEYSTGRRRNEIWRDSQAGE